MIVGPARTEEGTEMVVGRYYFYVQYYVSQQQTSFKISYPCSIMYLFALQLNYLLF
jgi:hypothetical protein